MQSSVARDRLSFEDPTRRARAKERLYVLCQVSGWGGLCVMDYFVGKAWDPAATREKGFLTTLILIQSLGLLITHYSRSLVNHWGWKRLSWRALAPRIPMLAMIFSALWCTVGYGFQHGVLKYPLPEQQNILLFFVISWIQGTILLLAWFCLYFSYNLFDRFNHLEIEQLRLAASVKDAELRALKSQINPHFIFNSLNSLRALIDEDPMRARQTVTQLANLLRYSLKSGQLETVPFEEELRVVNDYLALEQVRHEERLRLKLDVVPESLNFPVPPMLLQTLVENAVKYGISTRPEGGEISISARCANECLILKVTNPGSLTNSSAGARNGVRQSTGLGLKNAAERLRLLFGEQTSLQLRSGGDDLVVAEAVIPLHLANP